MLNSTIFWLYSVCRTEIFSGKTVTHDDISYEQACILYNLGELSHVKQIRFKQQKKELNSLIWSKLQLQNTLKKNVSL